MAVEYQYARNAIYTTIEIGDGKLRLRAEAVRKERTGIHARIEIYWNKNRLSYDQFNVERQEERTRLMRRAYEQFPGDAKDIITQSQAILELDMFCADLWSAWVGQQSPEWVEGDISLPPPRMLGPYLIEGGGTILFGPGGKGKSWMLHLIAQSMQHGAKRVWPVQNPANVLFINLERDEASVRQRIGAVNRALGLPDSAGMHLFSRRGYSLKDVYDSAEDYIQRNNIEVVCLDSITRAADGDLNKNDVANDLMNTMNRLCRTWIGIAHEKWRDDSSDSESHVFGSVMFRNAVDMEVALDSEQVGEDLNVKLEIVKHNVRIVEKTMYLRFHMDELGLFEVNETRPFDPTASTQEQQVVAMLEEFGGAPARVIDLAEMLGFEEQQVLRICNNHVSIQFAGLTADREKTFRLRTA